MLRLAAVSLVWLSTAFPLVAQDVGARRILKNYQSSRPTEQDLAMYRLDWASSLDDALERAARESRPIFLVIIHARYGDINSGHC
jgi:hypothetical protein